MKRELGIAIRTTLVTLLLTGILYPVLITGLAGLLFPRRASGSVVVDERGVAVGSELVAQGFTQPGYLQPRPSAAGDKGYDPQASGGSNYGVTSQKLHDRAQADAARLARENQHAGAVPVELVTASGSGLDPHLSPGAAHWQIHRIAAARGVSAERVLAAIDDNLEGRDLGILGEPRVNVLLVNLALDRQFGKPPAAGAAIR